MPILTAQHLQLITETAEALDNIETKIAELSYGTSADPQWSSKVNAIQATLQNIQEVANELKAYIAEPVVIEDLENVTRLTTSLKRTQQKVQLLQQRMIIPIRNYILQDNFPAVKTLFEKGEIFLEERDWQGDTLLLTAVRSGSTSIVEFLLKQGASLEAKNSQGDTAFTIAGQQRDKNLLNFLEKNKSIFGRDVNGETALHRAVRNGDLNAVTQLLKEGAFINAQNNQGETPLHILAATHGHIKMAKLLIEKGIDLALVDNKGDTALNKIVNPTAKKELTELLLRNRNQLSIRRLKNLIEVCRLHYVGDFESRVADEKLLNQAIQHLIGSIPDASNLNNKIMIADVMRSNLLVYLGHLISLKGNFTRDGLPGNFESSQVIYFLPLRARVLLEMIICIKKDFNDDYPGGYAEKQHVLDDLIDELAVTLEALHVRLGQWYVRYDLKCVDWGINAYTENIFDCIEKVMQIPGKSYVCDAGYTGHAVYAHFENHPDYPGKIIVRIDNLGEGNRHHDLRNQPHKNNTPGIKNLPHARVFPAQELRTPNSALNTCIRDALSLRFLKQSAGETDAAFKERVTMGLYGNSDPNITKADAARLKQAAIEQLYPWRGEQIVGNCVVKNWLVGMQIRLQQPKPANAPMVQNERWDHPLYHYFRVNELKYIPFKSYFEKKEAQKGPFALPDFASEKAMQAFHQSIAQDNIDKAKIQFGYTPLHLAVVSGELVEVEKQLQTGLDPLAKTKHGYNALHLAIINNHPHVVNYLLQVTQEQNALIRAKTTHGDTLLHLIAKLPEEDAKKMTTVISSNKISINEILSNEVNDEQKLSQEYIIQAQETSEIGVSWEGRLAKTQAYFEKIKEQRAMIQKKLSHVQAEITASRGNIELNNLRDQEKFLQDEDKNCIAAMGKLRTELQDSKKMVDLAFEHQINSINNALNHSSKPALQTTATTQASSSRATQKPRLFLSTFALEPVQKLKAFIDSVANRGEWEITHSGNTITVQFREESKHENKDKAKGKALLPQLQDCLKQLPEWGQSVISNKSEGNILHIGCRHEDQAQAYAKALREFFGIETANTHTPSHQQSPCTMQ